MAKLVPVSDGLPRCPWSLRTPLETEYHDKEWGVPCFDTQKLFEYLILDTFQAGLSWSIILKKREGFRKAFHGFSAEVMAAMPDAELEFLMQDPDIIRNRLKIFGARKNAIAYLKAEETHPGGFVQMLWKHVNGTPILTNPTEQRQVAGKSPLSDTLSKELSKAGFSFVGSTTIYAMMQAAGLVNDHLVSCHCHPHYKG